MVNMPKNDFSNFTLTAIQAALKASEILIKGFRNTKTIKKKEGKHNLVTEYDLLSEKIIISFIKERFPDHGILSEEEGQLKKKDDFEWIIDPLDGTVNFAHSIPVFAISLALKNKNDIICGVTYNPLMNELFVAEKGKGAYLNGNKLNVTKTKKLDDAILATGFPYDLINNPNNCIEHLINVLKLGIPLRRLGSASLDLAYVAAGRFDGYWETGLGPWDLAAGKLLIEEAKGKVTNWDGTEVILKRKNTVIATNSYLHLELLKIFKKI
jgi:myo-inositol-1(or 4)-monophosphatase